jgi:hypothetical protein
VKISRFLCSRSADIMHLAPGTGPQPAQVARSGRESSCGFGQVAKTRTRRGSLTFSPGNPTFDLRPPDPPEAPNRTACPDPRRPAASYRRSDMSQEIKQRVLDFFKSKEHSKTKFYINDLRQVAPEMSNKDFKKLISEMIAEGTLMYFSTGSTTMFQLAEEDVDKKIK